LYSGEGFLRHETDDSKKSFMASPGLSFSSLITPALDSMECAPVVCISEEDLKSYREGCATFVKASKKFFNEATSERVDLAIASWERYYTIDYVHSMADLIPSDYLIDWSCLTRPHENVTIDKFPVASHTAIELMQYATGGLDFQGGGDPILHKESKGIQEKSRALQDLAALSKTRQAVFVNQFLVCLRSKDDVQLQGKGFSPEEESLPFFLAKAISAVPAGCDPQSLIEVVYWRQPEGDPNKYFVEGQFQNERDAVGSGSHIWTGVVARNEVLYVDPVFKNKTGRNKLFDSTTLMELAELFHPQLRGWIYEDKVGLVYREPITVIEIGDLFIVPWTATPLFLKDNNKERLKSAGVVVAQANVRIEVAATRLDGQIVPDVSWFLFDGDNLNSKFKPFKIPSGKGKKTGKGAAGDMRSEVNVSALMLKISPAEALAKKLNNESKKKLIEVKIPTLKNVWVWDIEKRRLLAKKGKKIVND
jgi:hypothetical protein